ncbi:hypothetical protein QBC41DRAFT_340262 [Cercophora samala]|uniref:Uncharacterized protein n=1 Tax=Cercophora samala TaxID=330535 RepID=A0AA39Z5K0_9PEZI|nr:hypothetical protein QBC41DRAFT_340262 [Cercophora samala]
MSRRWYYEEDFQSTRAERDLRGDDYYEPLHNVNYYETRSFTSPSSHRNSFPLPSSSYRQQSHYTPPAAPTQRFQTTPKITWNTDERGAPMMTGGRAPYRIKPTAEQQASYEYFNRANDQVRDVDSEGNQIPARPEYIKHKSPQYRTSRTSAIQDFAHGSTSLPPPEAYRTGKVPKPGYHYSEDATQAASDPYNESEHDPEPAVLDTSGHGQGSYDPSTVPQGPWPTTYVNVGETDLPQQSGYGHTDQNTTCYMQRYYPASD